MDNNEITIPITTNRHAVECYACKKLLPSGSDITTFKKPGGTVVYYLCPPCMERELKRHSSSKVGGKNVTAQTVVRFTAAPTSAASASSVKAPQANLEAIHQKLVAARKKETPSHAKLVTPMSNIQVSVPSGSGAFGNQSFLPVKRGSSSNASLSPVPPDTNVTNYGYRAAHLSYNEHYQVNRKKTYAIQPGQVVTLLLVFGYMNEKFKFEPFSMDLVEGLSVSPDVTVSYLQEKWLELLLPKVLKKYEGFNIPWETASFRDVDKIVDLLSLGPDHQPLEQYCFVLSKPRGKSAASKEPQNTFKKPKNPFRIGYVVDEATKDELHDWLAVQEVEKLHAEKETNRQKEREANSLNITKKRHAHSPPASPQQPKKVKNKLVDNDWDNSDSSFSVSDHVGSASSLDSSFTPQAASTKHQNSRASSSCVANQNSHVGSSCVADSNVIPDLINNDYQDIENMTTHTPTRPNKVTVESPSTPNSRFLHQALALGGATQAVEARETAQVLLFPVPVVKLSWLMALAKTTDNDALCFSSSSMPWVPAFLDIEQKSQPQFMGAMKDCRKGQLTITGIGSRRSLDQDTTVAGLIVAKRFYLKSVLSGSISYSRLGDYETEKKKTFMEGNVLYWANALVSYAMSWAMQQKQKLQLQFVVPEIVCVKAGVAVDSAAKSCYVIEERLEGDWVKLVGNGKATPLVKVNDKDYELAEFLCFLQHVMWWKTGGVGYVSDFQGVVHCSADNNNVKFVISDPQIMTSPKLGDMLFGDGNVSDAFNAFPDDHKCAKLCAMFRVPSTQLLLLDFVGEKEDGEIKEHMGSLVVTSEVANNLQNE
ncbi:hypothetical protein VKT23_008123 [Stygiomarasmius scandens]|uniref:Alpha-type protein kinase domain-containing protein n=1 Tax=Marasmiellus scandens TaxID=2682957 RepID=A0ABR1JI85_9AGAR